MPTALNETTRASRLPAMPRSALCAALAASLALAGSVGAVTRDQAKRIHDRIAGVPPSDAVLTQMAAAPSADAAAQIALDNPNFYNVTLKNLAMPWTNRAQTAFAPLNDYVATVIGMVRDDVDFSTLLSADLVYVAKPGLSGVTASYSPANNDMYEQLENSGADLKTALQSTTQSSVSGLPAAATAGVITSRAAAQAFFINGTNRAMFSFTVRNHLCRDLGSLIDPTRPPDRVRQDVSRSPGGDSRLYLNVCMGCHSGMEPLTQAFAYYNYDDTAGKIVYTAGQVQPKYLINSDNFKSGYVTPDDHWENRWIAGPNQVLGWASGSAHSGDGAKSMGLELAKSDAFARCQVEKVFKTVCYRVPTNQADRDQVNSMIGKFKSGYKLKQVFADSAVYCMGS
ncbi:MAG: hypothetical protein U1F35_03935 [Steroidobacteraceae bacterium]